MEIGHSRIVFPNGSVVESITTADSDGATPPHYSNSVMVTTITPQSDADGASLMPPGYPEAFPGATLADPKPYVAPPADDQSE